MVILHTPSWQRYQPIVLIKEAAAPPPHLLTSLFMIAVPMTEDTWLLCSVRLSVIPL